MTIATGSIYEVIYYKAGDFEDEEIIMKSSSNSDLDMSFMLELKDYLLEGINSANMNLKVQVEYLIKIVEKCEDSLDNPNIFYEVESCYELVPVGMGGVFVIH